MLIINYFLKKVQGSDLPFPEDGIVSSDRETCLALTTAGSSDRNQNALTRRGSAMLPETEALRLLKREILTGVFKTELSLYILT
jgi:hypothetical protein